VSSSCPWKPSSEIQRHYAPSGAAPLIDVQRRLNMTEGFDVGLEMSGSPQALSEMIANMSHGGKIAALGIPAKNAPMDWRPVIFNMLTITLTIEIRRNSYLESEPEMPHTICVLLKLQRIAPTRHLHGRIGMEVL
jgi:threonine dehydrogenase-like Zn-dependent dehydrogenase